MTSVMASARAKAKKPRNWQVNLAENLEIVAFDTPRVRTFLEAIPDKLRDGDSLPHASATSALLAIDQGNVGGTLTGALTPA